MAIYEYLTLPEERLREKEPILHEVSPEVWPDTTLLTALDWNNASGEWHFAVQLQGFGPIITRSPAKLNLPYGFQDYIRIIFHDPTERASEINPFNFAERIQMTLWPGPKSPVYTSQTVQRALINYEVEPWKDLIGFERGTEVTSYPLPPKSTPNNAQ